MCSRNARIIFGSDSRLSYIVAHTSKRPDGKVVQKRRQGSVETTSWKLFSVLADLTNLGLVSRDLPMTSWDEELFVSCRLVWGWVLNLDESQQYPSPDVLSRERPGWLLTRSLPTFTSFLAPLIITSVDLPVHIIGKSSSPVAGLEGIDRSGCTPAPSCDEG